MSTLEIKSAVSEVWFAIDKRNDKGGSRSRLKENESSL